MKLVSLKIKGFKNLDLWDTPIDFTKSEGISVFVGNNGSGKSNVLEAISAIFYGLFYSKEFKFEFELEYEIQIDEPLTDNTGSRITNNEGTVIIGKTKNKRFKIKNELLTKSKFFLSFYLEGENVTPGPNEILDYLPSNVIALYSGEETRLYESYYKKFFQDYRDNIKSLDTEKKIKEIKEYPRMFFMDKDFWDITLLTMFLSVVNFDESDLLYVGLESILGTGVKISKIHFEFNEGNLKKFGTNEITNFVNILKGINDVSLEGIIELNTDTGILGTREELFKNFTLSYNTKDPSSSLINDIVLELGNGIITKDLSEGEKKRILILFVTKILADSDSIILLDEPDSYIHVGNKYKLKESFDDFLDNSKKEGEIIMTTHSPALMHLFDFDCIYHLENGKVIGNEKAKVLDEISGGCMSFSDQQIALNTDNDIILVEGKFDITYIQEAVKQLKYTDLNNIVFIPTGGASGLRLFIDKFTAKDNQKIIAILDADQAGKDEIKEILDNKDSKTLENDGFVKIEKLKNTFLIKLPKPTHISNKLYEIEDYFPTSKLVDISKNQIDTFKVLKDFSIKKDTIKRKIAGECKGFKVEDYESFKLLLELILKIKNK